MFFWGNLVDMLIDNFQNGKQKSEDNENQKKGSTRSSGVSGLIEKIKQQNQTLPAATISSSDGEFFFCILVYRFIVRVS